MVFSPEKNGVIRNHTIMKEPIFARIEIDLVDLVNKKNDSIKIILLISLVDKMKELFN